MEWHAPRGGGKRYGARDVVRRADLAARQLRSEAAKRNLDVKMPRGIEAKSVTGVVIENCCDECESIVGWGCYPNIETKNFLVVGAMQRFSLRGRADCSLRAQEAHGGVEPTEHSVDPLIANNQAELERGVEQGFCNNECTPLSRSSNTHLAFAKNFDLSLGEVRVTTHDNNLIKLQGENLNKLTETIHSPLTTHHSLKKSAFTLAEVLITLGIIGIVAALTIPSLIQKYKEKVTVNKVLSAYSLLSNAYSMLLEEYGTPDTWEDKSDLGIANMFAKKLELGRICSMQSDVNCYTRSIRYSSLTGYAFNGGSYMVGAGGRLKDMFVIFEMESPICRGTHEYTWDSVTESSPYWHACGTIFVDINGDKLPNRYGVDFFTFIFTDSKIIPQGTPPTPYYSLRTSCNPNLATSWDGSRNGNFCAAWIIVNKNMDYLHKTVSW